MSKSYNPEAVAVELLRSAIVADPDACLVGKATAREVAIFVAPMVLTCPKCGAHAGVNIDCDLCHVMMQLEQAANQ